MTTRGEKDKAKQLHDKCQSVLNALLRDEDNKYCVDCDAKGPRWASWNLGVFLCIRCAGIHRNLGVHISKVKSVNLDSWTPEQVVSLQQMGNSRARAVYEANLPDNFRRPQNDSSLESFIRAKYEHKKYIAREWVPPALPVVNWEKEIEENEQLKQKKKIAKELKKNTISNVQVPQLPKPKNPSPKPGRLAQATVASNNSNANSTEKSNTDLLGIQNGEDVFSGFLSAPSSTTAKEEKKKDDADQVKSEEESFFNQTAPTEKEKAKLTKDSILALYGTAPPVNNFNQFQAQPQVPYQQGFSSQQNFQNFSGFQQPQQQPQQTFPPQNGMVQFPQNQIQQFPGQFQGQFSNPVQWGNSMSQQNTMVQQNLAQQNMAQQSMTQQNMAQQNTMTQQNTMAQQNTMTQQSMVQQSTMAHQNTMQYQPNMQQNQFAFQNNPNPMGATMQQANASTFPANSQFHQMGQFQQNSNFNSAPNPFYGNQNSSLPQQFGNLSLSNPPSASPAPTLTSNIWQ